MSGQIDLLENVSVLTFDDKPSMSNQFDYNFYTSNVQHTIEQTLRFIVKFHEIGKTIRIRTNAKLSQLPYRIKQLTTKILRIQIRDTTPRRKNGMADRRYKPAHANLLSVYNIMLVPILPSKEDHWITREVKEEQVSDSVAQFLFGNFTHHHGKLVCEYSLILELAPR